MIRRHRGLFWDDLLEFCGETGFGVFRECLAERNKLTQCYVVVDRLYNQISVGFFDSDWPDESTRRYVACLFFATPATVCFKEESFSDNTVALPKVGLTALSTTIDFGFWM
jgi:hypothetical protein